MHSPSSGLLFLPKQMPERRFPPPWSAEVTPNCFIVRDANGQALSYVYYESEPGRRSAAKLLSKDEARCFPCPTVRDRSTGDLLQ